MNYSLYVNGTLCILDGDEDNDLVLSRAVNNIGDIQGRDSDAARDFNAAMIASNKLLFESAQVLNAGTVLPYRRIPARIEKNGNIISIGYCLLLEAGDVFRLSYFGGNADWFKLIGDKSIQDLDLSDYNHLWTATNVRNARSGNTDWTDVYNYPNVDYGPWQVDPTVEWYHFFTGVFQKYIIWKIFKEAGFTITGDFWDNNSDLAAGFMPFCGRFKRDRDYTKRNAGEWDTPVSVAAGPSILNQFGTGDPIHINFYRTHLTNTISSTAYNILQSTGFLTVLDAASITFNLSFDATNTDASTQAFGFNIVYTDENGDEIHEVLVDATTETILSMQTKSYSFTLTRAMSQTLIKFEWVMDYNPDTAVDPLVFEITGYEVDESFDDYLEIDTVYNYVTVSTTLPDMKQKDVLVHFFNQFCLMCDTDHQINYVRLFDFNTVNGNKANPRNWSAKLDLSATPRMKYVFNEYAQSNKFLYKHDEQNQYLEENPEYHSGVIDIDNENLEVEKVVFQSEFATIIRQENSVSGTVEMAFIPKFQDGDEVDCAPYIGKIAFEVTHLITMDGYGLEATQPAMHGLSFEYLLETYYPAFIEMMTYAKIIDCLMHLDSVDMNQLDFSYPVWIDYFNAFFYVNLIDRYKITAEESTAVQLVRL